MATVRVRRHRGEFWQVVCSDCGPGAFYSRRGTARKMAKAHGKQPHRRYYETENPVKEAT